MAAANHEQDIRILEHAQTIILDRIGPMVKECKEATDRLAALQGKVDLQKQQFHKLAAEISSAQRTLEGLHVKETKLLAARRSNGLVKYRNKIQLEAEQVARALRHGSFVVEGPPGSSQATVLVDNRLWKILRENEEKQIRFTLAVVHGVACEDLNKLPADLRLSQFPRHGAVRISPSAIPCPGRGVFAEVVRDDMTGAWEQPTVGEEYEMFSVRNGGVLCYSGTFVEVPALFACNEDVIGKFPELFDDNVVSKTPALNDDPMLPEIRIQWHNEDNRLRLRVYQYKRFNRQFLADVQEYFRTAAREKEARRLARLLARRTRAAV